MIEQSVLEALVIRAKNIPDAEILQDIADTKHEIGRMTLELPHMQALADLGDRMCYLRVQSHRQGIKERQHFVECLQALLTYREERRTV